MSLTIEIILQTAIESGLLVLSNNLNFSIIIFMADTNTNNLTKLVSIVKEYATQNEHVLSCELM
jgi:hypothetical protein